MSSRQELFQQINEASFAVNDITLYLDTHPTDEQALAYFDQVMQKRKEAMKEYESQYEPLLIDCVNVNTNNSTNTDTEYADKKHWTWADGPLPWEGGAR